MRSVVSRPLAVWMLALVGSVLAAGCNNKPRIELDVHELLAAPEQSVSIYQLAGQLRMQVRSSNRAAATLNADGLTIVVFADPNGQILVNGNPVGPTGGIVPIGDTLFVPSAAVEPVRAAVLAIYRQPSTPPRPYAPYPPVRPPEASFRVVVVDAGHGGHDPGAMGPGGAREKNINLAVALAAADILRSRGVRVILTRADDTFVELNDRAAVPGREQADLFVSIHADAAASASASGYTVYVSRSASRESIRAAQAIHRNLAAADAADRGIQRADFRVLVRSGCPAALVELGYLSNRFEARRLSQPGYQQQLARSVAAGIMDYLR